MQYAYLFETRGIQRFLFASGKLRDMLGGSELLDYLCAPKGLLDQTLEALGLSPEAPRRAGAAFYLLFQRQEEAQRLQAAWRLACARWLPGVERVDALTEGNSAREAIRSGLEQLRQARNLLSADLPRPGPLAERSPRTGLAAVQRESKGENLESLDAATRRQRGFERPDDGLSLAQRFLDEESYIWPVDFEESSPRNKRFPLGERRLVGLLHADGNGLGELLRTLNVACAKADDATYIHLYRTFSEGLSQATQAAAQQASREILLPNANDDRVLPARPLVLGGDDLTILVRADLALSFAKTFLDAFEHHSKASMQNLLQAFEEAGLHEQARQLPEYLTACAGLCYMKCSQPFQAGHDLAESLCKRAKGISRKARRENAPMPATLALHKVQDSLLEEADSLFNHEHCVEHEGESWQLALHAYALKADAGLPTLDDLEKLSSVFSADNDQRLNDRPLRELITLWHGSLPLARQAYERWRQLAARPQDRLKDFDKALSALLTGPSLPDLPCSRGEPHQSPLSDLLTLLAVQNQQPLPKKEYHP
ncbi:Cas10/Cmr2 second palm domain-containing protein [Azotobacter vinelandii]|uniref:Cas10/Cmr2 second palm domain-containing protein n=1 Tax=Azotobacter vinelandii TaxID=354 RepID=UPI0026652D7C|nr:hypothetical protein [Azotobacter vinelandii]WKN24023.1 hypothetical protein AVAEIV_002161 [Azotobacter vinelandii]